MEKTNEQIMKNTKVDKNDRKMSEDEFKRMQEMNIIGWNNAMDCANDIWNSIHNSLLKGNLVFAYKSTDSKSEFGQIVVVQNVNQYHDFAVGVMLSTYTMLLPHVPFEYLETTVLDDFKKYKVGTNIQEIYKKVIENYNPNKKQ